MAHEDIQTAAHDRLGGRVGDKYRLLSLLGVGVWVCAISRIATRRSGREPSTKIFREPGIGRVTDSDSCPVCSRRSAAGLGMAFIGIVQSGSGDEAAAQETECGGASAPIGP